MVTKFELLDDPFTEKEVNKVLKKLKNNKSAADDRIRNEMIKFCTVPIFKSLVHLFNFLFETRNGCRGLLLLFSLNLAQMRILEITKAYV